MPLSATGPLSEDIGFAATPRRRVEIAFGHAVRALMRTVDVATDEELAALLAGSKVRLTIEAE